MRKVLPGIMVCLLACCVAVGVATAATARQISHPDLPTFALITNIMSESELRAAQSVLNGPGMMLPDHVRRSLVQQIDEAIRDGDFFTPQAGELISPAAVFPVPSHPAAPAPSFLTLDGPGAHPPGVLPTPGGAPAPSFLTLDGPGARPPKLEVSSARSATTKTPKKRQADETPEGERAEKRARTDAQPASDATKIQEGFNRLATLKAKRAKATAAKADDGAQADDGIITGEFVVSDSDSMDVDAESGMTEKPAIELDEKAAPDAAEKPANLDEKPTIEKDDSEAAVDGQSMDVASDDELPTPFYRSPQGGEIED